MGARGRRGQGGPARFRRAASRGLATARPLWPFYLIVYAVGGLHLVEVHLLDPWATAMVQGLLGTNVELFATVEAPLYRALGGLWTPERVAAMSAYYLLGFIGLLAWAPVLVAATGDQERLRKVLLTYPILYLIGLPGYLLVAQPNPYVALGLADPFSPLQAGLEATYYLFTTPDNTFPSLHVAFTVALTVHLARSRSGLIGGAAVVHGTLLVISVVYLRVHWLGDVVGGVLAAWLALRLADRAARGQGWLGGFVERLDRIGQRGSSGSREPQAPGRTR